MIKTALEARIFSSSAHVPALGEMWEHLTLGECEHSVSSLLQPFYSLPPDDDPHKSQMDPHLPFRAMPRLHSNYGPSSHYSAARATDLPNRLLY